MQVSRCAIRSNAIMHFAIDALAIFTHSALVTSLAFGLVFAHLTIVTGR